MNSLLLLGLSLKQLALRWAGRAGTWHWLGGQPKGPQAQSSQEHAILEGEKEPQAQRWPGTRRILAWALGLYHLLIPNALRCWLTPLPSTPDLHPFPLCPDLPSPQAQAALCQLCVCVRGWWEVSEPDLIRRAWRRKMWLEVTLGGREKMRRVCLGPLPARTPP